jgi:sugar phosphate isomerase/epimerase
MNLAFSTNAFTRFPLAEALRGIADSGFRYVEILADSPHADPAARPPGTSPEAARATRRELERLSLKVSNVNANCSFSYWHHAPPEPYFEPSLISPVEQYRLDRAARIRSTLDFAAAIGAPAVSITTGRCLAHITPEAARSILRDNLLPLLDYADRRNVNLGIECEPGLYIEYADELAQLIADLDHPRLGANLDTGHSHVLGEDLLHAFTVLKGRIWNLHIEDLPGSKHYHMIPGTGTFPWSSLLHAIRSTGYTRPATVELYTQSQQPHAAAAASYRFLSDLFSGSH